MPASLVLDDPFHAPDGHLSAAPTGAASFAPKYARIPAYPTDDEPGAPFQIKYQVSENVPSVPVPFPDEKKLNTVPSLARDMLSSRSRKKGADRVPYIRHRRALAKLVLTCCAASDRTESKPLQSSTLDSLMCQGAISFDINPIGSLRRDMARQAIAFVVCRCGF